MAKKKERREVSKPKGPKKKPAGSRLSDLLLALFSVFIALGTAFLLFSSFSESETEPSPITSHLIEFYGRECPHCVSMAPVVSQVEKDIDVTFSRLEVWHNSGNYHVFENYLDAIGPACGGGLAVPAFYNVKTGKALCGEVSREELIAFAKED